MSSARIPGNSLCTKAATIAAHPNPSRYLAQQVVVLCHTGANRAMALGIGCWHSSSKAALHAVLVCLHFVAVAGFVATVLGGCADIVRPEVSAVCGTAFSTG